MTADQVILMAIGKHLGKRTNMSYDAMGFFHMAWEIHLAFKALHRHRKFVNLSISKTTSQNNIMKTAAFDASVWTSQPATS